MNKNNNPLSKKTNLVIQELESEVLIYDLIKNKAFCLNETSALIWNCCDGSNSISQISELATKKLNSPISEDFVWLSLTDLKKAKLVDFDETQYPKYKSLSRRELVKKIGISTVAALPIVISIVSPPSTHAFSCVGPNMNVGDPVMAAADCATNYNALCCNMMAGAAFMAGNLFFCQCSPTP